MPCTPAVKPCGCPENYNCKCATPPFPLGFGLPAKPPRVVQFGQVPVQVPDDSATRKALALHRRFEIAKLQAEACGIRAKAGGGATDVWMLQMEAWIALMQKISADLEDLGL